MLVEEALLEEDEVCCTELELLDEVGCAELMLLDPDVLAELLEPVDLIELLEDVW